MDDLDELYQSIILGHNRHPRNEGPLPGATHDAEGYNPLCGDHIKVQVHKTGGVVDEVRFTAKSCAIAKASASLMTVAVKGLPEEEVLRRIGEALELLGGSGPVPDPAGMGEMAALSGVRKFPARVKCATLAWHTLANALQHPLMEPERAGA
jgi:nitrogen fixation NifU-like protein